MIAVAPSFNPFQALDPTSIKLLNLFLIHSHELAKAFLIAIQTAFTPFLNHSTFLYKRIKTPTNGINITLYSLILAHISLNLVLIQSHTDLRLSFTIFHTFLTIRPTPENIFLIPFTTLWNPSFIISPFKVNIPTTILHSPFIYSTNPPKISLTPFLNHSTFLYKSTKIAITATIATIKSPIGFPVNTSFKAVPTNFNTLINFPPKKVPILVNVPNNLLANGNIFFKAKNNPPLLLKAPNLYNQPTPFANGPNSSLLATPIPKFIAANPATILTIKATSLGFSFMKLAIFPANSFNVFKVSLSSGAMLFPISARALKALFLKIFNWLVKVFILSSYSPLTLSFSDTACFALSNFSLTPYLQHFQPFLCLLF